MNITKIAIILSILYFYKKSNIECLILACILLLFCFEMQNTEKFTTDEALQNLASMYNSGTLTCTNLKVTNNADIKTLSTNSIANETLLAQKGDINLTGKINGNTTFSNDVTITGDLNASKSITSPTAKLGKFRLQDNIVADNEFYIRNKGDAMGNKFVFQNDGSHVIYRCDGWVGWAFSHGKDRGWGNGCPTKPSDNDNIWK